MSELTIGEVAAAAGVATSAIRFWEEEGLLERARRRNGRRVYDPVIHDRVGLIRLAQSAGFTIPEIRTLLRGFPPRASAGERWRALVDRKQTDVRRQIEELRRMLAVLDRLERCECPDLDACGAVTRNA
jgi:MerR family transcriptional regulator, redox-sensitive transcriptional activator SoxR